MYYVIQSVASKRYFNLENDEIKWNKSGYKTYKELDQAERDIRFYRLRNVEIITIFPETIDNSVTRTDRNLAFVNQLQQKAKFFRMESVGISSLDKLVVDEYMYKPRKFVSRRELYCRLPNVINLNSLNEFYIIEYEIASPGHLVITNYHPTKITPDLDEKVAIVKVNHDKVIEKILITELKNINKKKHDRADTFVVDNPHVINNKITNINNGIFKEIKKDNINYKKNQSGINAYNKHQSLMVNIDSNWYEIFYCHVKKGVIHVNGYHKINRLPVALQKVAFISRDNEQGIYKLSVGLWGARKKYLNAEGVEIETETKDYMIENPHEIL